MNVTITAMMPTRDRAPLLAAAARSVLAQTCQELELLILDDGSSDNTPAVCAELAAADSRVRILRNEQSQGIPAARNQLLAQARGAHLAICDSDDLSRPQRFERQLALLEADPGVVGAGTRFACFTHVPDDGAEPGWHWGLADGRLPFMFPTGMFRTEALRAAGGFDPRFALAEDLELCYRLATGGGRFAIVDEVLLDYRIHAGSITRVRTRAREWHNLRAQLAGLRMLGGRFTPRGYAVILQSAVRTAMALVGLRR